MTTNNSINCNQNANLNTIYVSKGGSDTSGNGTIIYPYLTLYHAISTITNATSINPFKVVLLCGNYQENTNLILKPYIYIDGGNSDFRTTGTITADTSWNNGGYGAFSNFNSFFCSNGLNFNFSGASSNNVTFSFINISSIFIIPTAITGSGNFTTINFNNCNSSISPVLNNCNFNLFNYIGLGFTANYATVSSTYNNYINNSLFSDVLAFTGDGNPVANINIFNSPVINSITASGANVNLLMSGNSITSTSIPSLSSGSTVSYINYSDGINANYSPTNYVPTTNQLKGHLIGINNALALVVSSGTEVTGTSQVVSVGKEYIANNSSLVTFTLPAIAAQFAKVRVTYKGLGGFRLMANTGQTVIIGAGSTSSGGTVTSTSVGASITLEVTTANTVWTTITSVGTFTIN